MEQRIRWVDVYKGLAILLVVVGHATGLFNSYIYQFHMAAFFFISGYTSKLGERGLIQTWVGKAYSIYLPYFSFFLITLGLVWLLNIVGGYSALFKDPFPGFVFSLSEFPAHRIYVNLLGATWFLITIFGIYVVQRFVLFLCFERVGTLFMLVSVALFLTGYGIMRATIYIPDGFWYLIFIGQFYFSLGYLFSRKSWLNKLEGKSIQLLLIVGVNVVLLYIFSHQWPNTVDYPSRSFGNAFINSIGAMNGIFFLFIVSVILDKLVHEKVVSVIVKIGQNTLGILVFHFMFFKVGYATLAVMGIVDWGYVANFTPTHEIGDRYWLLISGLSIALSITAWNLILKIQLLRLILGQSRDVVDRLYQGKSSVINRLDLALSAGRARFGKMANDGILETIRQNKIIAGSLGILIALAVLPMLEQGVVSNDELQTSFWAQLGWSQFWQHYSVVWAHQGRILGVPLNIFSAYVGFLSTNVYVFRSISILLMLIVFALYGWLIARLRKSIYWGIAIFSVAFLFLPIVFEHTLPNSFVALFCIPFILAFFSFHLFLTYLEKGSRLVLLVSMLAWFFFLTGYEAFLTLTPVFLVIAYIHRKASNQDLIKVVMDCRHVLATTFILADSKVKCNTRYSMNKCGMLWAHQE
jgi:fucose 4-O-acetylase-like acetyltransferase